MKNQTTVLQKGKKSNNKLSEFDLKNIAKKESSINNKIITK
jgi:hypothetical protein